MTLRQARAGHPGAAPGASRVDLTPVLIGAGEEFEATPGRTVLRRTIRVTPAKRGNRFNF